MNFYAGFAFLAAMTASVVHAAPLSSQLELVCGQSDQVWDYIYEVVPGKPAVNVGFNGRQGETGRQMLILEDQSWLLTFEYFSDKGADYDVSCVVATGERETAFDATNLQLESLPDTWWGGPELERPRLK